MSVIEVIEQCMLSSLRLKDCSLLKYACCHFKLIAVFLFSRFHFCLLQFYFYFVKKERMLQYVINSSFIS